MLAGARGQNSSPTVKTAPAPPQSPAQHVASGIGQVGDTFTQAIHQVFAAQPPHVQQRIVQAARQNPQHPAAQALVHAIPGVAPGFWPAGPKGGLSRQQLVGKMEGPAGRGGLLNDLAGIPKDVVGGLMGLRGLAMQAPGSNQLANIGTGPTADKFVKNAASDLVNLPAEAVSTVGTVGKDVVTGKPGKAISDVVSPFVQLAEHPGQAFIQHPLLSALMFTGALHGASRLAAAPVRALANPDSALGRAVSTQREGVALTGNLTHERPPYSLSPTIKVQQKSIENSLYRRAPTGELVPRTPGLRARQLKNEIGSLVGVRERIRRVNREMVQAAREKAVTPSVPKRVLNSAKTAAAYGPQRALIPGADVLARIADATIRRPDTITEDLQRHLAQVSANRPNLLEDPQALKAHDAYVKQLTAALGNKALLKNPKPAFDAAAAYARDYRPVEAQALKLGHFGDSSAQALQRRELMHYAVTHMGAKMDPELGLVASDGARLSNQAILDHLRGPEGTGGRVPAYTPDRVRFDRSNAYYVSSERRPLPATAKNTLYAYTHGLTDPGHGALTEQHVLMRGIVDAHRAQNHYLDTLGVQKPGGGYWQTFAQAKRDAPAGYQPLNIAQPFHGAESLAQAVEGVSPASIEEEALRHSLDLSARLQPGEGGGRWALVDKQALKALRDHQNQISPNTLLRTIRGLNTQFRSVALSTSAKHVPGVAQENLIRDIAAGVGFRSWLTGRRMIRGAQELSPERGREIRTHLTGGQVAGMTEAGRVYRISDHWQGTSAYPFLRAMEATFKAPGPRQLRTAWHAWTRLAIRGTKRMLEEQHQIAGLGKAALREHGYAQAARTDGFMGLVQRGFGLHGQMLEDATKGLFDPAKARQMRAVINQMYGKWTDLSPSAQTALMFSPFGLWWVNSVRFLARMPVDQPVKTSLLASATAGTQQERRAAGLDIQSLSQWIGGKPPAGLLPSYEQGGIPVGGKIVAQNYYSPFGTVNDPIATASSLIQPWAVQPVVLAPLGLNWLGHPLESPGNPKGRTPATGDQRLQAILDSALSSFMPLYTKAKQVTEGGASPFDVTDKGVLPAVANPPTKGPKHGALAGLKKAALPVREYKAAPAGSSAATWGFAGGGSLSGSSGWGFQGGSGGGSSGSGWGFK